MPEPSRGPSDPYRSRLLLLIVAVAIALRLAMLGAGPARDVERAWDADTVHYVTMGQNLLATGTLGLTEAQVSGLAHVPLFDLRRELGQLETADAAGVYPTLFRTPGYPAVIAAVLAVTSDLRAVLLLQCLAGGLSVIAVWLIALRLTGRPLAAAVAALIAAVNPASVLMDNQLLSESLFVAALLWGLALVLVGERRGPAVAGLGGLLLGAAVLVRPIGIAVAPLAAGYLLLRERSTRSVLAATLVVLGGLGPAAAWTCRNHAVSGQWVISTVPTFNAWYYTAAHIDTTLADGDVYRDWPAAVEVQHARLAAAASRAENVYTTMRRLATQRVTDHPGVYAGLMADSTLKLFTDHSVGALAQMVGLRYRPMGLRDQLLRGEVPWRALLSPAGFAFAASGWNALLAAALPVGVIVLWWSRRRAAALLVVGVVLYFVLATQTNGLERFRLPIVGLQAVAFAAAVAPLLRRCRGATAPTDNPAAPATAVPRAIA